MRSLFLHGRRRATLADLSTSWRGLRHVLPELHSVRCRAVPRSRQRRGCRVSVRPAPSGLHVCGRSYRVFVVRGWTAHHRGGCFSLPPPRDDIPHHVGLRRMHSWVLRGTEAATACTSCPLGSITLSPGLSACSLCLPGRYGVEAGCESCRTGHFTAEEGETACASCPSGYIARSERQSSCTACASGWYGTAFACEECPPGEYAENLGQSRCARCSVGTIAVLTRSSACDACPAGQYGSNASGTACETCNVVAFTDSGGASACTRCGDHDDAGSTLWTTVGVKSIPPNTENSLQYGYDENENNNMSNETKRETNYSMNNK